MSKVRVYEVARELGVENRDLIQRIATLGIQVRNHMSVLDPVEVDRIKRSLGKDRSEAMVEERIRPTVVRRKRRKKTEEAEPALADTPETIPSQEPEPEPIATSAAPTGTAEVVAEVEPPSEQTPVVDEPTPAPLAPPVQPPQEPRAAQAPAEQEQPEAPGEQGRFSHDPLPPGVMRRGKAKAPSATPLSEGARRRIVAEHAAQREQHAPRRREIRGRSSIGPTGRPQGRPGKKRLQPGKKPKQTEITVPGAQKRVIRIEDNVQLQTLAQRMSLKATDVLMKLMELGVSGVHINSTLDADTAAVLAGEFNYEVENVAMSEDEIVGDARGEFEDKAGDRAHRPPVVTVMGHVDHGKTSLLDKIRAADVVAGEAGGITQHIGAYRVDTSQGTVVFLDTPGHEAFTAMRARGAQATDIVVLVVAADDGVMPQTKEAVAHAQAAKVPIVVAVNKIDKPEANPDTVKNELAALGLQPEDWGGDTVFIPCSAITGEGIDGLLENVLLQAEILELTANSSIPAEGVVLEAYLDRGRGPVANVLIRDGSLDAGDYVVAGGSWGRVRAMTDDRGTQLTSAGPATPVEVLGLAELPSAGDLFYEVTDQRKAQQVAGARKKPGAASVAPSGGLRGLDQFQAMMQSGDVQELRLVVKADVQGSVEALQGALTDLATEKVKVNVIHTGVGGITENDVMLASASQAIVLGFNVRPQGKASSTAKKESVEIRTYSVIYEAIDDVRAAMKGLLAPKIVQEELGRAEVRQTFGIPKIGTIAGCMVLDGKINRGAKARLVRDGVVVWEGPMGSLRRFKEDTKEVQAGMECGIGLQGFNDIKEQDVIECYEEKQVEATLE
ncbi:MAG: translation initiation factor IF-2 [Myxococcales bacterium]|nr:translation initiation factor IF-2 [Deltaproteobacteria bacterium]MBT8482483.1 translation initiation factor IF-2 [Deltaproteobacteria bacterium]NNL25346.1 translation initiation factor IF-2 [Myxococcales bacterium]RZV54338.1 MAG: translation initiation factor IF-2 [Deltaproteobacteria bacterium]